MNASSLNLLIVRSQVQLPFSRLHADQVAHSSQPCARSSSSSVSAPQVVVRLHHLALNPSNHALTYDSFADDTLLGNLEGDPQESSLFLTTIGPKIPSLLRPIISFLIRNLLGDAIFAGVFESAKRRTVTDMQDVAHQR